jgi:predicted nucleotide-binding protein (sugar kinase/HSP70/actin superfamily)
LNALHAFILGDLLNAAQHQLRPFAVQPDAADRAIAAMADTIADHFEHHRAFEFADALPAFLLPPRTSLWYRLPNTCTKIWSHLYGKNLTEVLPAAAQQMLTVEVDWLRVKPVVKVIGEFWAQMTESDGNFRMLDFLEKEGAEVSIEPISSWLLYLLHSRKMRAIERRKMAAYTAPWRHPKKALATRLACWSKQLGFVVGAKIYTHHFERLARLLALPVKKLTPQAALTALASPYYNTFLRGGEGHLEVSKTLYYTRKKACHLVLALKPFGCLPSVQSDGVQAALVERFAEVNFLPVETSAEGEIHAYSRVQMALAEAKAKAKTEFAQQLKKAHHSLEEIRAFVAQHAELRHPLCPIPRHPGVVSTAANFLIYTDQLMSGHLRKQGRQLPASGRETSASALDQITSTGD